MMKLMDAYWKLNRSSLDDEKYLAAQVYSTAEDLTDALFKGVSFAEGFGRFLPAMESNLALAATDEERDAWTNVIAIAMNAHKELS